jgi:phosphoribosyl 1,2-cyclic phosphodiesterase
MLAASGYPAFLKRRIGGAHGHLANHAAADILKTIRHAGLNRVVAAHLSAQNNQPRLAQQALAHALDWPAQGVDIASAAEGTQWVNVAHAP